MQNAHASLKATITITNNGITRLAPRLMSAGDAEPILTINYLDSLVGDGTKKYTFSQDQGVVVIQIFSWVENTSRIRDVIS